jgi:superoxide reductase
MTLVNEVYKCMVCGNVVEVLHSGPGQLVCCGKPMENMKANTVDASKEKHVPVVERIDGGIKVTVGSVAHPMEEKHYIEWIEVVADGKVYRENLRPGMAPQAVFRIEPKVFHVREYCNIHGLWRWDPPHSG